MLKKSIWGFTFVELIVVITIMAIVSVLWFAGYKDYLSSSRDSTRVAHMKQIHDGLELFSLSARLPMPEESMEILTSGKTILYQGDFW